MNDDTTHPNVDTYRERGRDARRPTHIPWRGWYDITRRIVMRLADAELGLIAAAVAFYGLLATFPAIAGMTAVAGLIIDAGTLSAQYDQVAQIMPPDAAKIVLDQADAVAGQADDDLTIALIVSVAIALFAARRGTAALLHGLNVAYSEREKRGFVVKTALDFGLTAVLMLTGLMMLALLVVVPAVLAFVPIARSTEWIVEIFRWLIVAVVFIVGMAFLYRYGPCRRNARWRWLTPGAFLAGVLWFAGSWCFTWYVANFASYNETFGSLGGVIILLMWLWLSAFIILIGATVDAEIEAQTARDSTVGPDRPMGQRGAYKADNLGETY